MLPATPMEWIAASPTAGPCWPGESERRSVGLVSMDVTLVDLSLSPEVLPGDYVTLLGQEGDQTLDASEWAERCHTISYEILCGIGKRVPRLYR